MANQVVGQNYDDVDRIKQQQRVNSDPNGFDGNTQIIRSGGLMPWTDQRTTDPAAFNVRDLDNRLAQSAAARDRYDQRAAPGAAMTSIDGRQQDQMRARQMTLADMLQNQANGQGNSVAQMQLQRARDANIAQSMAMGASQRGANQASALRNIGYQGAAAMQQSAADSGMLRLQEQQASQNQLGQLLAGARGQDQGLATSQAQLYQQTRLANQQAGLQQTGLNDNMSRYYQSLNSGLNDAQQAARFAREQQGIQYDLGLRGVAISGADAGAKAAGAGAAALGGLAALLL